MINVLIVKTINQEYGVNWDEKSCFYQKIHGLQGHFTGFIGFRGFYSFLQECGIPAKYGKFEYLL